MSDHDVMESTLQFLAKRGWQSEEDDFFVGLVEHLGQVLGVGYAFVDQIVPDEPEKVETIALYAHGSINRNFRYDLAGTPCAEVLKREVCCYVEGIQQRFPTDLLLTEMNAQSYVGVPLESSNGDALGLIAVIDTDPLKDPEFTISILRIVAIRAAAELQDRQLSKELEESRNKFKRFAEASADIFWETDKDLRFSWISAPTGNTITRPDLILGRTRWEVAGIDPDEDPNWAQHRNLMLARQPIRDFVFSTTKYADYESHWRVNGLPTFDQNGEFVGYRGAATEITQQRVYERQLRQRQKMETIGQLTGGVAHDFNNLLAVMQSNLELIQMSAVLEAPFDKMLTRCMRATQRGKKLTQQFLALARQQDLKPEKLSVFDFLEEFAAFVSRTIPSNISFRLNTATDLPAISIDASFLHDALLNLVINARDALQDGGEIVISASPTSDSGPEAGDNTYVILSVSDTGSGIPPEVIERVFEPFFTTKEIGKGSGLGLSMVRGFIEQSGGYVRLESIPGKGTSVLLHLPIAVEEEAKDDHIDEATPIVVSDRNEKVLLVEDDEDVRESMASMLHYLGYEVLVEQTGDAALTVLQRSGQEIDLVLSDITMPGMVQGDELANEIIARFPRIAVVLISGYAGQPTRGKRAIPIGVPVLSKPVKAAELQASMRRALTQAST